jgi:hypothetical protein
MGWIAVRSAPPHLRLGSRHGAWRFQGRREREEERLIDQAPGRETPISKDPIGVDPIGNDPLDMSDAPPQQGSGPNQTLAGGTATATKFFVVAIVLGVIFVAVILFFMGRT